MIPLKIAKFGLRVLGCFILTVRHPRKSNLDRFGEVAAYQYLHRTNIPAPKVYDYAGGDDPTNRVGVGCILMEKLPGRPMNWSKATA